MKRKVTAYKYEKRVFIYQCVGYEGHECGLVIKRHLKLRENQEPRCRSCGAMHRKLYQAHYYEENKDKALAYQKDYNANVRKAQIQPERRRQQTNSTRMLGKRTRIKESFNPSDLMNQQPNKLEKSINRILAGVCEYSGVK